MLSVLRTQDRKYQDFQYKACSYRNSKRKITLFISYPLNFIEIDSFTFQFNLTQINNFGNCSDIFCMQLGDFTSLVKYLLV